MRVPVAGHERGVDGEEGEASPRDRLVCAGDHEERNRRDGEEARRGPHEEGGDVSRNDGRVPEARADLDPSGRGVGSGGGDEARHEAHPDTTLPRKDGEGEGGVGEAEVRCDRHREEKAGEERAGVLGDEDEGPGERGRAGDLGVRPRRVVDDRRRRREGKERQAAEAHAGRGRDDGRAARRQWQNHEIPAHGPREAEGAPHRVARCHEDRRHGRPIRVPGPRLGPPGVRGDERGKKGRDGPDRLDERPVEEVVVDPRVEVRRDRGGEEHVVGLVRDRRGESADMTEEKGVAGEGGDGDRRAAPPEEDGKTKRREGDREADLVLGEGEGLGRCGVPLGDPILDRRVG